MPVLRLDLSIPPLSLLKTPSLHHSHHPSRFPDPMNSRSQIAGSPGFPLTISLIWLSNWRSFFPDSLFVFRWFWPLLLLRFRLFRLVMWFYA
ncbi:hypothetical protein Hanom_Chr01g00094251 [Helianthus anomalus]